MGAVCPVLNNHKHLFLLLFLSICAVSKGMAKTETPPQSTSVAIYLENAVSGDYVMATENLIGAIPGFEGAWLEAKLQPGHAEVLFTLHGTWTNLPANVDVGIVHLESEGFHQDYLVRTDGGGTVLVVIADF
ncbi:MAG: hypothetical protein AAF570_19095 [Bacteroidota bacterium]